MDKKVYKDGSEYCCCPSINLMTGIAGFGKTKKAAIIDYLKRTHKPKKVLKRKSPKGSIIIMGIKNEPVYKNPIWWEEDEVARYKFTLGENSLTGLEPKIEQTNTRPILIIGGPGNLEKNRSSKKST